VHRVNVPTLMTGSGGQFSSQYYVPPGTGISYLWTFAPGSFDIPASSIASPGVVAQLPGSYQGTLKISNSFGSDEMTFSYTVQDANIPVAEIDAPASGAKAKYIHFDGSGSLDPTGIMAEYQWEFSGDEEPDYRSPEPGVDITFPYNQTATVRMRCLGSTGLLGNWASHSIVINATGVVFTEVEPNGIDLPPGVFITEGQLATGSIGSGSGYPGNDGSLDDCFYISPADGSRNVKLTVTYNPAMLGSLSTTVNDANGFMGDGGMDWGTGVHEFQLNSSWPLYTQPFRIWLNAGNDAGGSDYTLKWEYTTPTE
jgi:hypothetical protein